MTGFFLNMQILYEQMIKRGIFASLCLRGDQLCLKGTQFYTGQEQGKAEYVYLVQESFLEHHPFAQEYGSVILIGGEGGKVSLPNTCSYISVSEGKDLFFIFNLVQEIFAYYGDLERRVNQALSESDSLNTIIKIAAEHFKLPLYYHDEFYHILAFSDYASIEPFVSYNERKRAYIQGVELVNQFRISRSYRETLDTQGGQLWESDYDEGRAVYANVWVNHVYKGRLILQDNGRAYTKADLYEMTFFAQAISILARYRNTMLGGNAQILEQMIMDAVDEKEPEQKAMLTELETLHWDSFDSYICGVICPLDNDLSKFFIYSVCTDIEEKIPGSYTCYYKDYIYMIVNLTKGKLNAQDLRMKMAYLIREGLMHMGVSNIFEDIYEFPVYLRQAVITLEYSEKDISTIWYNEFGTYGLKYWMTEGFGKLGKNAVIPPELLVLKKYDHENGTRLLETLEIYLTSERNSTLTSQILKIHRSTLPYRLKHIQSLTHLNLELSDTRLYLMMGFFAMKKL